MIEVGQVYYNSRHNADALILEVTEDTVKYRYETFDETYNLSKTEFQRRIASGVMIFSFKWPKPNLGKYNLWEHS